MRSLITILPFLLCLANAQVIGTNARPTVDAGVTFKATSQLVIETVVVKDKDGKPVEGLTAKDFQITEDNVVQPIKFFEFQKMPMHWYNFFLQSYIPIECLVVNY